MEIFEKTYLVAKETEWWDRLNKAIEEYGQTDPYTMSIRARWVSYYETCKHFFPEYRPTATLDG